MACQLPRPGRVMSSAPCRRRPRWMTQVPCTDNCHDGTSPSAVAEGRIKENTHKMQHHILSIRAALGWLLLVVVGVAVFAMICCTNLCDLHLKAPFTTTEVSTLRRNIPALGIWPCRKTASRHPRIPIPSRDSSSRPQGRLAGIELVSHTTGREVTTAQSCKKEGYP